MRSVVAELVMQVAMVAGGVAVVVLAELASQVLVLVLLLANPSVAACPLLGSALHGRRAEDRSVHTGGIFGSQMTVGCFGGSAANILDPGAFGQWSS